MKPNKISNVSKILSSEFCKIDTSIINNYKEMITDSKENYINIPIGKSSLAKQEPANKEFRFDGNNYVLEEFDENMKAKFLFYILGINLFVLL